MYIHTEQNIRKKPNPNPLIIIQEKKDAEEETYFRE